VGKRLWWTRKSMSRYMLIWFLILICAPSALAQDDAPPSVYQVAAENNLFRLEVDHTTLAFRLTDKRSGYVWQSGLDTLLDGDRLNTSWRTFAQGGISIEYFDARATNRRISLGNSEHVLDITPLENGIAAQVTFTEVGITVGMRLTLEADGVRVEVPFESILEETPDFRLSKVYLYPFLGAARGAEIDGYMVIPDGAGSLIRFSETTRAQNMFYGRYYGTDVGMTGELPYDPRVTTPIPISYPAYGVVHGEGENAFLSTVEEGAAYGELHIHPSGVITNFNFLYSAFIYAESYFQATNRSGAGVTVVQRERNEFNAVLRYRFLTGESADYVGIARAYQDVLIAEGRLCQMPIPPGENIGIHLEFLGGDKERILVWWRFIPMTTVPQMREILADLALPNTEVVFYGWQPYGASSMPPLTVTPDGTLGSVGELVALADEIRANGGQLSLYFDPQFAFFDEPGYSPYTDLAMAILNTEIFGYNRLPGLYMTYESIERRYRSLAESAAAHAPLGLAIDGVGRILYSDHRDSASLNREEMRRAYQTLFADAPVRLGMYAPNDYMLGAVSAYYHIPIDDNGYIYTSQSVPFLPIALSGCMPYYGSPLNFSSNREGDLLRHIEYGVYPAFFLTYEDTANMLNTPSIWMYSSSYEQWGEDIRQTYNTINAVLAPVRGQRITGHTLLIDGVFMTTYANGRQIVVNYLDRAYNHDGTLIEARSAVLLEPENSP